MRLKLILQHDPNQVLPIDYEYLISSWIYRTIGQADSKFSEWLHQHGFGYGGKKYKLFTFAPLRPAWYDLDKKNRTFRLTKGPTTLELSFFIDEAIQHFVSGLFQDQRFKLASGSLRADFEVSSVEVLSMPDFCPTMQFQTIKPICISHDDPESKYAAYLSPLDEGYKNLLLQNLLRKQQALQLVVATTPLVELDLDVPFVFKLLSAPKERLLRIKQTKVKGYAFDFELMAPKELMRIGFLGGFGEKNSSLGMGMVKEKASNFK